MMLPIHFRVAWCLIRRQTKVPSNGEDRWRGPKRATARALTSADHHSRAIAAYVSAAVWTYPETACRMVLSDAYDAGREVGP
jgi:hypothetical protein